MVTYQLDRFEGDYAVFVNIEDFSILNVSKLDLPPGAQELDIIRCEDEQFIIDYAKTEELKTQTYNLFLSLID